MRRQKYDRKIGTYRSKDGRSYPKYKDDENYVYIKLLNGHTVTIEGDGETKSQDEIQLDIDETLKFDPPMSRREMKSKFGQY